MKKVVVKFVKNVITRKSMDENRNENGGDYDEGHFLYQDRKGRYYVRYWTSYEGGCCPLTGEYQDCGVNCFYWRNGDCRHPDAVLLKIKNDPILGSIERLGVPATDWDLQKAGLC